MENYGLSQISKYQKNSIVNLKLSAKSDEFMELCRISSRVVELESYKLIDKECQPLELGNHFLKKYNLS
jgi:hypothetical protein